MTAHPFIVRLASRALIRVAGPDWRSFLQGLLSNDVDGLAPGQARFAGLLSPQGRLLFDLIVIADADGAMLDVEAHRREAAIQRLFLYRLRAKVEIGPDDRPVAASNDLATDGWIQDPRLPALGVRSYGREAEASVPDDAAYEAHRLALGVPGPADWGSDRIYPIEANFDLLNGIDFGKGCFVGQETTSRMHRRAQVKSRMLPLAFDGPPPPHGAEVMAGDLRAGEVLSGIDGRAMALVRLDRIEGAQLTVGGRGVRVERPLWFRP
jgi:tRNA-modifying protein YgfZ